MTIMVGEKVRHTATKEEGMVVTAPENSACVLVRFDGSFDYVVPKISLERISPAVTWGYGNLKRLRRLRLAHKDSIAS
jgi:hypothetical protein